MTSVAASSKPFALCLIMMSCVLACSLLLKPSFVFFKIARHCSAMSEVSGLRVNHLEIVWRLLRG